MGPAATSAATHRTSPEILQGGREDGRSARFLGFTPRRVPFGATQTLSDRLTLVKPNDAWMISDAVIAACMEVHTELGPGLLESVYEAALCEEFSLRSIPFKRQQPVSLAYKGRELEQTYRIDLVVAERLIVEIKAVDELLPLHAAQAITYLRLTGIETALLVNFNAVSLRHGLRRLSRTHKTSRTSRPPVLPVKSRPAQS
jgi:GxxExxY protein